MAALIYGLLEGALLPVVHSRVLFCACAVLLCRHAGLTWREPISPKGEPTANTIQDHQHNYGTLITAHAGPPLLPSPPRSLLGDPWEPLWTKMDPCLTMIAGRTAAILPRR